MAWAPSQVRGAPFGGVLLHPWMLRAAWCPGCWDTAEQHTAERTGEFMVLLFGAHGRQRTRTCPSPCPTPVQPPPSCPAASAGPRERCPCGPHSLCPPSPPPPCSPLPHVQLPILLPAPHCSSGADVGAGGAQERRQPVVAGLLPEGWVDGWVDGWVGGWVLQEQDVGQPVVAGQLPPGWVGGRVGVAGARCRAASRGGTTSARVGGWAGGCCRSKM